MNRKISNLVEKLVPLTEQNQRSIHCSAVCLKTSAGKYKITPKRDRPLTYEMANPPYQIVARKSWNSFNCSNLEGGLRPSQTAIEDMFIRKFIVGTFHSLVCSEVIIKRQFNHIRIAFLLRRGIPPHKVYFLIGYTEELLANFMQCKITLELQTIAKQEDTYFKYI